MLEWKERWIVIRYDENDECYSCHVFKTREEAESYQKLAQDTDRLFQLTQLHYEIVKGKEIE